MTLGKQVAGAAIATDDDPLVAAGPMFPVSSADVVATLPAERETDRSAVLYFEALQLQPMRSAPSPPRSVKAAMSPSTNGLRYQHGTRRPTAVAFR